MLESEGNKDYEENKYNRVDMLAEDSRGQKILIEVQIENEDSYFHRMLFGTSKVVSEYLESGQGYDNVAKVYSVNIVYFKLGEGTDFAYHGKTEFRGMHDHDILNLSPKLREKFKINHVYEIFPEYYILKANDFDRLAKTPLEQWMYFLKHSKLPEGANAPGLHEAARELKISRLTKEQRRDYEQYIDNMRSLEDVVDSAYSSGRFEGLAEGILKGKLQTAKQMKAQGLPLEIIAKCTDISLDELQTMLGSNKSM